MAKTTQNISLKSLKNIRDLGGLETSDGKIVQPKKLLRSPHLMNLSSKDQETLVKEYDLSAVIDLRTDVESSEKPDVIISGVEYFKIPLIAGSKLGLTHEKKISVIDDVSSLLPDMPKLYAGVLQGESAGQLRKAIQTILEHDRGAVLYHCTEGKDRTGIVSLFLLTLLDVPRPQIMKDYLYTNEVNKRKAMLFGTVTYLLKHDKQVAQMLHDVFLAKAEYLQAIFDYVDSFPGGMNAYIAEVLEVTDAQKQAFKKRCLR